MALEKLPSSPSVGILSFVMRKLLRLRGARGLLLCIHARLERGFSRPLGLECRQSHLGRRRGPSPSLQDRDSGRRKVDLPSLLVSRFADVPHSFQVLVGGVLRLLPLQRPA